MPEGFTPQPKRQWVDRIPHEPSAAERIAEHTGRDEYLVADLVAEALAAGPRGTQLTSGERVLVASVIRAHRG